MRRNIPSLSMLQAFESAGRLHSFTRAAHELHVTQSAISRHIRSLEAELGFILFQRLGHRVALTPAAIGYTTRVRAALDEIEAATLDMKNRGDEDGIFHLLTPPTFGARWLVPRLPKFTATHPQVELRLSVRADQIDFTNPAFDAAISNGPPPPTSLCFEKLTDGVLVPVCSPHLLPEPQRSLAVSDLQQCRLLELGNDRAWALISEEQGLTWFDGSAVQRFEYFDAGIQSAVAGGGILLVQPFLVLEHLARGSLRIAFHKRFVAPSVYYYCYPRYLAKNRSVMLFANWLKLEIAATLKSCAGVLDETDVN